MPSMFLDIISLIQLYVLNNMNYCHKQTQPHSLNQSAVSSNNDKISLKNRGFLHKRAQLQQSHQLHHDSILASSRLEEFLNHHNDDLIKRKKQNLKYPKESSNFFNCFQSAQQVLNAQKTQSKHFMAFRHTNSTLSSSTESDKVNHKQNSNWNQSQVPAFNVDRQSIVKQVLFSEYQKVENDKKHSELFNLDLSRLNRSEVRPISGHTSSRKDQKTSLKKQKPIISEIQSGRKDILTYDQQQENLNPCDVFNPEKLKSPTSINFNSGLNRCYQSSREVSFKRRESGECSCGSQCFWLTRWMTIVGQRKSTRRNSHKLIDMKMLIQIQKDIPRTPIGRTPAETPFYQRHLRQILIYYASSNPQVGYVQGMNIISSAIIAHTKNIDKSTAIFRYLMNDKNLSTIYIGNLEAVDLLSQQVSEQVSKYSKSLSNHLVESGVEMNIFIRTWYFSLLGSFVPLDSMPMIIDKFMLKGFKGLNSIILMMILYLKEQLLSTEPDYVALKLSNSWLINRSQEIDWRELVNSSDNIVMKDINL